MLIRPMDGALGADVIDVDVTRIDAAQLSGIREALLEYHVLALRDQRLDPYRLLLFASNGRPDTRGSYDIYASRRCGESWSAPRPLGADVNSSAWDFGPRESPDGRFLFFTSNRATTDQVPEAALSYPRLLERIRGPRNGLRDVYRVETAALDLAPPCPHP